MAEQTMTLERRFVAHGTAPVGIEQRADGSRAIIGHAAVFFRDSDPGTEFELFRDLHERIMPGAFDAALKEQHDARALFNHDPDNLLGRVSAKTVTLSVDEFGLRYEIPLDADDPDHQRVAAKIKRGDLTGSSFAFIATDQRFVDGAEGEPDIREIHGVELFDVGPVTFPAYEATDAGVRAVGELAEARTAYEAWKKESRLGKPEVVKTSVDKDGNPITLSDGTPVEVDMLKPARRDDEPEQPDVDREALRKRVRARLVEIDSTE